MDYDPQKAARVWQRVRGEGEDLAGAILSMTAAAMEDESLCRSLLARTKNSPLEQAAALQRGQVQCLRGMCVLLDRQLPQPHPVRGEGPMLPLLRRCYGRMLQAHSRYGRWTAHPEYGPAFQKCVRDAASQCALVLQAIGSTGK